MYVCIGSSPANISQSNLLPPLPLVHCKWAASGTRPAPSGAIMMPNTSWTPLRWDDPLATAKVDEYALHHPTTTNELWLEWIRHWMLREWCDHSVKLTAPAPHDYYGDITNAGQPAAASQRVGNIVWGQSGVQYDLYGRRGWMDAQTLDTRIRGHFFVLKSSISTSSNKLINTQPSNHECTVNYRFHTLDCLWMTMGYSRNGNGVDPVTTEQVTHVDCVQRKSHEGAAR